MDNEELLQKTRENINFKFPKETQYFKGVKCRKDLLKELRENPSILNIRGVYIIVHKDKGVIYVGCSGKVGTDRGRNPENGIGGRLKRSYTPYSFIDDSLCYIKRGSGTKKDKNNYKEHISLEKIDIFIIPLKKKSCLIPSVLEHIIIQTYYFNNTKKELPLINKEL